MVRHSLVWCLLCARIPVKVCREAVVGIAHEEAQRIERLSRSTAGNGEHAGLVSASGLDTTLRPVNKADFDRAITKLSASVSERGREVTKVWDWNEQYGEIKKKKKKPAFSLYL